MKNIDNVICLELLNYNYGKYVFHQYQKIEIFAARTGYNVITKWPKFKTTNPLICTYSVLVLIPPLEVQNFRPVPPIKTFLLFMILCCNHTLPIPHLSGHLKRHIAWVINIQINQIINLMKGASFLILSKCTARSSELGFGTGTKFIF